MQKHSKLSLLCLFFYAMYRLLALNWNNDYQMTLLW